jgi:UDP-N-acetyl-2-amino-2-deoxyglucuronate dehydrogenase
MDRLKIAIVGCGDIARFVAVGCLINRKITAVACMDTDGTKARAFGRRFLIGQVFDDYDRMLEGAGADAVYLAVPHHLHRAMIEKAAGRGLPVLCEKPVATTMDDGLAVCRLSEESGVKIGINYQYRYDAACYALVKAAEAGELGRPLYGRCNVPWRRTKDYFAGAPWHAANNASGGGTLITQASHIIDIALLALGGEPVTVRGDTARRVFSDVEVEDLGMGIVGTSGGALLSITSSMVAVPERPASIEIYGSAGTGLYTASVLPSVRFFGTKAARHRPPVWGVHALFRSIEGFRRWVQDGIPYLTPAASSLRVLAVVEALYRSAASGRREAVDDRYRRSTAG